MLIVIRGAGDIASGIALRLFRSHMQIVMTDIAVPTAIRRTVSFSEAIRTEGVAVEGVSAKLAHSFEHARAIAKQGRVAVLVDAEASCVTALQPDVLVDAILAKKNLGTKITDAPIVIGVGPGFSAGIDCHAAVETMRGHYLGRVIYDGSPMSDTTVPGFIGGYAIERVLRAPADGIFSPILSIGSAVKAGEAAGSVNGILMPCTIDGTLRGILADGVWVYQGMKCGDIDPRCERAHCFFTSDKALAVGGGVLEAIMNLSQIMQGK